MQKLMQFNPALRIYHPSLIFQSCRLYSDYWVGCYIVPGGTVFILIIVSSIIKIKSPQNEKTFFWWVNFTGGMMGALLFAIPSMFIYPIYLLFPENIKQQAQNASIILPLFTIVGIIVGIGLFFIARSQYRGRPRWTQKTSA